jgi:hypothetical protein
MTKPWFSVYKVGNAIINTSEMLLSTPAFALNKNSVRDGERQA